ncbi:MAG: glycosyltransferase family 39 protein [Anaerolineae bacterium]|nr:glycosyltransferase family 39 protein [Anaerolineae bacterium]
MTIKAGHALMPYWIADTLATTPAFAWVYLGVGVPWALAVLPRATWRRWPVVLALAFALGPLWLTAWMFVLGSIGANSQMPLLRLDLILIGTVVIALIGVGWAWRRRSQPATDAEQAGAARLQLDERLLIGLIVVALVVRWFVTAYWPFIAYDTLWVYGYQGRLYSALGYIPTHIGYYPPFFSLQYAFGQLVFGAINDHAARAVIPFVNLGSSLSVYALGALLFGRRTGIYAAALWTLYPHVGDWSRMGDLEIALANSFTLASAFFAVAWTQVGSARMRYAILSGVMLGLGLWTKPTMGAFILGVGLVVAIALIATLARKRDNLSEAARRWLPQLQLALIVGLAALPLGGVWYIRNLLLGHTPIVFPSAFWLTQAMRSGVEFGWPLLAVILLAAYLILTRRASRSLAVRLLAGLALMLAGTLPTILMPRRMTPVEGALLIAGVLVYGWALWRDLPGKRRARAVMGLLWLLALPYFVTWFWSYSYHYRLSFAIVPLLLLPTALILARWTDGLWAARARTQGAAPAAWFKPVYLAGLIALAAPAIVQPLYDQYVGWDVLVSDALPDDLARQRSGNQALINVVDGIQIYIDEHGEPPVVVAPGVETLPFFFPLADIRIDSAPTRLDELDGVTYFIDSHPQGTGMYEDVPLVDNQVIGALRREDIMRRAWGMDDGIFRYDVYELNLDHRYETPQPNGPASEEVVFGDFARYLGYDIGTLDFWVGRPIVLTLYWESLTPADGDYMIYVHLRDSNGDVIQSWDAPVALDATATPPRYYSTNVWQPGEYITDVRRLTFEAADAPLGGGYKLVIGMYDLASQTRVPVTADGQPAGDGYVIEDRISVVLPPS